jgi:hypothetical protein
VVDIWNHRQSFNDIIETIKSHILKELKIDSENLFDPVKNGGKKCSDGGYEGKIEISKFGIVHYKYDKEEFFEINTQTFELYCFKSINSRFIFLKTGFEMSRCADNFGASITKNGFRYTNSLYNVIACTRFSDCSNNDLFLQTYTRAGYSDDLKYNEKFVETFKELKLNIINYGARDFNDLELIAKKLGIPKSIKWDENVDEVRQYFNELLK